MKSTALDCSSSDTARTTVAASLGMNAGELRERLRGIQVPAFEEPTEYLVGQLTGAGIEELPRPEVVHWFHATRVVDPESFTREGILPKAVALPRLRKMLQELARGLTRKGDSPFWSSAIAKSEVNDEGPYAFLLRTIAVESPPGHHPYTRVPEAVEDIAGDMLGENFGQLVEKFQAATVPCVVTFRGPGTSGDVARALWYVHLVQHGCSDVDAANAANTCFAGDGTPVPPGDVISVVTL